jgi:hypothetical protein
MDLVTILKAQWDRAIAVGALLLGAVVLVVGYRGISGTPHVAEQLPYFISAGAFGVLLVGVAGMMWVSADLRDQWRELRALRERLERPDALLAGLAPLTAVAEPEHGVAPTARRRATSR